MGSSFLVQQRIHRRAQVIRIRRQKGMLNDPWGYSGAAHSYQKNILLRTAAYFQISIPRRVRTKTPIKYVIPTARAMRMRFVVARFLMFMPERKARVMETRRIMVPPVRMEGRGEWDPNMTGSSGKDDPIK